MLEQAQSLARFGIRLVDHGGDVNLGVKKQILGKREKTQEHGGGEGARERRVLSSAHQRLAGKLGKTEHPFVAVGKS